MSSHARTRVWSLVVAALAAAWPTSVLAKRAAPTDVPPPSEARLIEGDEAVARGEQDQDQEQDQEQDTEASKRSAESEHEDEPSASSPPAGASPRYPYPRLDPLGLGLTIGGSVVLTTGLGVSAGWWTTRSQARANADRRGDAFAEGTQARRDYLARQDRAARGYLVAGSILVGVGLGTTIGGAVHLVVHRRRADARPMALQVMPLGSRTLAGLAVRGRF